MRRWGSFWMLHVTPLSNVMKMSWCQYWFLPSTVGCKTEIRRSVGWQNTEIGNHWLWSKCKVKKKQFHGFVLPAHTTDSGMRSTLIGTSNENPALHTSHVSPCWWNTAIFIWDCLWKNRCFMGLTIQFFKASFLTLKCSVEKGHSCAVTSIDWAVVGIQEKHDTNIWSHVKINWKKLK